MNFRTSTGKRKSYLAKSNRARAASLVRLLLAMILAGTGFACAARSDYMREVSAPLPAMTPAPGKATVVFIRNGGVGGAIVFTIIDQNGRFIGDAVADGHFPVELPPGEYLFIAECENTAVMRANLAPDHIYYVEVSGKMGVFRARVGLDPIKPGTDAWKELNDMLSGTARFVPLTQAGQAELNSNASDVRETVAHAKEKWQGYSPAERAEASLEPGDGIGVNPALPPTQLAPQATPPAGTAPAAAQPVPNVPPAASLVPQA